MATENVYSRCVEQMRACENVVGVCKYKLTVFCIHYVGILFALVIIMMTGICTFPGCNDSFEFFRSSRSKICLIRFTWNKIV